MGFIFISYRRDDSAGHTGRLFDALSQRFGSQRVFRDIEDLEPGVDFVDVLDKALNDCEVLLVIIGNSWINATGKGGRRLDQPNDFVRMEVAKALERKVRVVPVLVAGAAMPDADELPEELRLLARRNAFELSDTRWDYDVGRLGDTLAKVLEIADPATSEPETVAPAAAAVADRPANTGVARSWPKVAGALAVLFVVAVGLLLLVDEEPSGATPVQAKTSTGGVFAQPYVGIYETTEGELRLWLTQKEMEGGKPWIRGAYDFKGGRLIGIVSPSADSDEVYFEGYWVQDDSTRDCGELIDGSAHWGRTSLVFYYDTEGRGNAFEGEFGICDAQPNAEWLGRQTRQKLTDYTRYCDLPRDWRPTQC